MNNYVVIARFDCDAEKKLNKLMKSFEKADYWLIYIKGVIKYENNRVSR